MNIFTNAPAICDFEENDLTDVDSVQATNTGSNSASNAYAYAGTYSWRAETSPGHASGARACGGKLISWPAGDIAYLRYFLYIDTIGAWVGGVHGELGGIWRNNYALFGGNDWAFASLRIVPGTRVAELYCRHGNNAGEIEATGITWTPNLDQWYEIEIMYDKSGANAACELWIDGVSQGSFTSSSGVPTNDPDRISIGFSSIISEADIWIDSYIDNIQCENARIGAVTNPYPIDWLRKEVISGYHCFISAYLHAKRKGYDPLKLPDGTIF